MGGASKAGIVGAEGHLNPVEQTLTYLAILDQIQRRFVGGHLDRCVIICCAHDQVRPGHQAALIGPVVMRERPARRFDDANPLGWNHHRLRVDIL